MPTYDYQCERNGEILEVKHKINDAVSTWGEFNVINLRDVSLNIIELRLELAKQKANLQG